MRKNGQAKQCQGTGKTYGDAFNEYIANKAIFVQHYHKLLNKLRNKKNTRYQNKLQFIIDLAKQHLNHQNEYAEKICVILGATTKTTSKTYPEEFKIEVMSDQDKFYFFAYTNLLKSTGSALYDLNNIFDNFINELRKNSDTIKNLQHRINTTQAAIELAVDEQTTKQKQALLAKANSINQKLSAQNKALQAQIKQLQEKNKTLSLTNTQLQTGIEQSKCESERLNKQIQQQTVRINQSKAAIKQKADELDKIKTDFSKHLNQQAIYEHPPQAHFPWDEYNWLKAFYNHATIQHTHNQQRLWSSPHPQPATPQYSLTGYSNHHP